MEGNWVAGGEWRVTGFEWGILDFGWKKNLCELGGEEVFSLLGGSHEGKRKALEPSPELPTKRLNPEHFHSHEERFQPENPRGEEGSSQKIKEPRRPFLFFKVSGYSPTRDPPSLRTPAGAELRRASPPKTPPQTFR